VTEGKRKLRDGKRNGSKGARERRERRERKGRREEGEMKGR